MTARLAPVLVVGHQGMLGRAWHELLAAQGIECRVVGHAELDVCDAASVERHISDRFPTVVNCTAWTDVDGAESREDRASAVNTDGVRHLAERCRAHGSVLVHYSTDYVFDGMARTPYAVDDALDPINAYGRSKAGGERAIAACGTEHLLIRTSWLYAPWGNNFVRTMARLTSERDHLRVVDDQHGRPSSAQHLARACWELLQKGARGTFHVTDGGECTWFELASHIARVTGASCRVEPCTSEEFPRPAPRPAYSVLDISRTEALLGPLPHWQHNVTETLEPLTPLFVDK